MAGVKIEQGTLTHRKTLRLKGLLGIGVAQAVGHLTMLWVWAASSTKDGSLAGMTPTEIAEVSGWAGEPADFLAAMIDAGYIDEAPGGFRLHDWAENTGQIDLPGAGQCPQFFFQPFSFPPNPSQPIGLP